MTGGLTPCHISLHNICALLPLISIYSAAVEDSDSAEAEIPEADRHFVFQAVLPELKRNFQQAVGCRLISAVFYPL